MFFRVLLAKTGNAIIGDAVGLGGSASGKPADSGSAHGGSNPSPPANVALSSSGLGHRPLTAETGVQIPLGLP